MLKSESKSRNRKDNTELKLKDELKKGLEEDQKSYEAEGE